MKIVLELTLDEADLVSRGVYRDRGAFLDERLGRRETHVLSEQEMALVPVHQAIMQKIEDALTQASKRRTGDASGRLHQARLAPWTSGELLAQLSAVVDGLIEHAGEKGLDAGAVSPLAVAIELLCGELGAFVLFGRVGTLDPPREDGKVPIAVLERLSDDPKVDEAIRRCIRKWIAEHASPNFSPLPEAPSLNQRIDSMIGADHTSSADELLGGVRALCAEIPIAVLLVAIEAHRLGCHQDACPVLFAMEAVAAERRSPGEGSA